MKFNFLIVDIIASQRYNYPVHESLVYCMYKLLSKSLESFYNCQEIRIKSIKFENDNAYLNVSINDKIKHLSNYVLHSSVTKPFIDIVYTSNIDFIPFPNNAYYLDDLHHTDFAIITGTYILKRYYDKNTKKYFVDLGNNFTGKSPYTIRMQKFIKEIYNQKKYKSLRYLKETLLLDYNIDISLSKLSSIVKTAF